MAATLIVSFRGLEEEEDNTDKAVGYVVVLLVCFFVFNFAYSWGWVRCHMSSLSRIIINSHHTELIMTWCSLIFVLLIQAHCVGDNQWDIPSRCARSSCVHHYSWELVGKLSHSHAHSRFHSLYSSWCARYLLPHLWLPTAWFSLCPSHSPGDKGNYMYSCTSTENSSCLD